MATEITLIRLLGDTIICDQHETQDNYDDAHFFIQYTFLFLEFISAMI